MIATAQVVTETFRDATAPGWTFAGVNYTPNLTSGGVDPAGDGWLRLTSPGTNQATSAYYNTAFTAANATVYASFEYQSWGGSGADGITFFLFDGSTSFSVGANGGSLGYAQKTVAGGGGSDQNGLAGGYLGIALDEYGNFSNGNEGRTGGIGFTPDAIAVRGPGSGLTGYDYLGGSNSLSTSIDSPGASTRPTVFNQVQMLLSPTNQLTVTLQQGGSAPQTVLSIDLSGYARPETLKYGFSSGTGDSTNYHEIRNLNVSTLVANLWDGGQGDGLWGSSNNWDPNIMPAAGSDILLNNTFATTAQTIDTQTNRTVRSLSIDAPFTYTINNNTLTFDAASVPGFSGIAVTQTRGVATHNINSGISLANDIYVRNNSTGALNLTGNISLGANDVTFDGTGATTVTGAISGSGTVIKNDSGTAYLNAANTYSGGTTINAGTLSTNNNSGLGSGSLTLAGGTLASTASNTIANTTTLTGNSGLSGLTLSGNLTQSGGDRTLTLTNATISGNVALSESSTGRTLTVNAGTGTTSTISGIISNGGTGAGGLTKTGDGTVVLSGANTYTGTTTINTGTLRLGASDRISNTSNVAISGGVLDLNGYSEQVNNLTWSSNGEINFGTTGTTNYFLFQDATPTPSGVLTISNWESSTDVLASQSALGTTILDSFYFVGYGSGATQGTGATVGTYGSGWRIITPTVTGWKTWDSGSTSNSRWSTGQNWDGNTTPVWGTSAKIAFGTGSRTTTDLNGNRTVNAIRFDAGSASFTLGSSPTDGRTLTFDSPTSTAIAFVQQKSSNDQLIQTQNVVLAKNTVFDLEGAGNLTVSSAISGSGNLVKENTGGTLILSGNNSSYAGNIYINAGTLRASSSNALGNTTGTTTIAAGGTLELGTGSGLSIAEAITASGTGVGGNGAIRNSATSGTNTLSGTLTLADSTAIGGATGGTLALTGGITSATNASLSIVGTGNTTMSGAITTGTGGLTINSTGTTTLSGSGANTFTGTTTVNAGTLVLNKTAGTNALAGNLVIGDGSGTDTVTLNASNQIANTATVTVNSSGVFNLNNQSETIARLDTAAGASTTLGTGSLSISGSAESTFAGSLTGASGSSLNKSGTGKISVTGSSGSFAGSVNVTAGIVNVSGAATNMLGTGTVAVSGTGNLELQNGATLTNNLTLSTMGTGAQDGALQNIAGTNTVSGAITLAGTTRIQSDSGTLNVNGTVGMGAHTLNLGGSGNINLANTVSGTGAVTKDGTGTVTLTGAANHTGGTTINAGTLALAANDRLADSGAVTIGGDGTLDLAGFDETIATLTGTGLLQFGAAGTGSLTLGTGASVFGGQYLGTGELIIGSGASLTLGAGFTNTDLKITLAGGTLNLAGYTGTLGNLNITGNSIIDFGAGIGSTLDIQSLSFSSSLLTLSINNWVDTQDFFYSATNPGPQGSSPMNQVVFNSYTGNQSRWDSFDNQITPVPEPSTYGALLFAAGLGFFGYRRWRQAKK